MSARQLIALHTARVTPVCRLVEWKPWPFDNPSLLAHRSVCYAGGWIIHMIPIPVFACRDGSFSLGAPDAPEVYRDGPSPATGEGGA
jgi:hypothetical protein